MRLLNFFYHFFMVKHWSLIEKILDTETYLVSNVTAYSIYEGQIDHYAWKIRNNSYDKEKWFSILRIFTVKWLDKIIKKLVIKLLNF